jgi:hypothetical protein
LDEYLLAINWSGFKILRRFSHFATVINYYPLSDAALRQRAFKELEDRLGTHIAMFLVNLPLADFLCRRAAICASNRHPGRLFAFLCAKGNTQ